MDTIKVARLHADAVLPTRKHPMDAGVDVYALHATRIPPHQMAIIPTGVTFEICKGYVGLLKPKGRNDHLVGSGVIDAGYQGELLVKVINPYERTLEIGPGEAIAQLLLVPVITPRLEEVGAEEIHTSVSSRGNTGGIVDQARS